jgi:hypothetical protein
MINYNNKTFRSASNSNNGEASRETLFYYKQDGNNVSASCQGGGIVDGHLSAMADENGQLTMRYQHINIYGIFMTGTCISIPEILPNGKIRLHEQWQWTCGDYSKGESIVEEI